MSKGQHKPNLYEMFSSFLWGGLGPFKKTFGRRTGNTIRFIESIFGHLFVLRHDQSIPQSSANHECAFVWHVEPFISL